MKKLVITWVMKLSLFVLTLCMASCRINPPLTEYSLARAAYQAAKQANAGRYAPGSWDRAQSAYRRAVKLFKEEDFNDAKKYFELARVHAERAELAAKLALLQKGDEF